MSRALFFVVILCQPWLAPSQSLIEEAVTGLLGRTSRMGRNFADLARGQPSQSAILPGLFDTPQKSSSASVILRPEDGTLFGGLFRGLMKDVDDSGNVNTATFLHPDQHQLVGALIGGYANGRATTTTTPAPKPEEEILGIIESMARRRKAAAQSRAAAPAPAPHSAMLPTSTPAPAVPAPAPPVPAVLVPPPAALPITPLVGDELNSAPGALDEFRRDVQRDAPECSEKAKAQLSKVLGNFRKGVLECVGVEDADLSDVINRLRHVLVTADRLPSSLMHNLRRCSAAAAAAKNTTSTSTSSVITRIPPPPREGQSNPSEVSAARCVLLALADARDRLHKIPSEAAAFSRRVAFLMAGTKTDTRVRACVASQLTSMAHPIVATARQLAGCVMVGPEFTTE